MEDDYLVKALNELRRRTAQDTGANGALYDPTDFHSSTLEELTRRIIVEKGLKEEIARLARGNDDLSKQFSDSVAIRVDDNLRKSLEGDISKLKVDLESQLKEASQVQTLVEQRDTASQKDQENLRLIQQLQASQAELQDQNYRLNADNVLQAHRLRELDYVRQELLGEVDKLKRQRPGSQKPPPGQTTDAETKSPGDNKTALSKSIPGTSPKGQHNNDQEVIVLSSDKDEMPVAINRRRLRTRAEHGEGQGGVNGEHENPECSERQLSTGLPPLERNLPLSRRFKSAPPNLNLPDLDTTTIFTRQHLNTYLGGNSMTLQVRIAYGNQKSVAKRFGITSFMCPNLDHNPWAPCYPGQDGYIFVGLGYEEGAFESPEIHELFIQFATKKMFYAGRYSFQKVNPLTIEEWKCIPPKVKDKYCKTTLRKNGQVGQPVEPVLAAYDEGRLEAPCVLVRFLHFDLPLYKTLLNAGQHIRPVVSTASASKSHQGEKRKHDRDGTEPITTPRRVKQKGSDPSTPNDVYDSDLGDIYA